MPTVSDITPSIAVVIALGAAWYSRKSSIASRTSAKTAQRALELIQDARLVLTDAKGGYAKMAVADGRLTLWVTNGGAAAVRIRRIDVVSRVERRPWYLRLSRRHVSQSYARNEHVGLARPPELKGGGSDGGKNVAEIVLQLDKARQPHRWGWLAPDAPDPAQAVLAGDDEGATIAVEITTEVLATGVTESHTVNLAVHSGGPIGYYRGLRKGTIIEEGAEPRSNH